MVGHQDEAEDHGQHHVPGEHVGEKTHGQHDVLDQQPHHLDEEHEPPEKRLEDRRHVEVGHDPHPVAHETQLLDAGHDDRARVMSASAAVTLMFPVAEQPGNHSQQVVEQHEEKDRPEIRQEPVGPVTADRRPRDVVADEQEHRLESCW